MPRGPSPQLSNLPSASNPRHLEREAQKNLFPPDHIDVMVYKVINILDFNMDHWNSQRQNETRKQTKHFLSFPEKDK